MPAIKIPFTGRWFRVCKNPDHCIRYEWELVEYCTYQRYYCLFFLIEINDWGENA